MRMKLGELGVFKKLQNLEKYFEEERERRIIIFKTDERRKYGENTWPR